MYMNLDAITLSIFFLSILVSNYIGVGVASSIFSRTALPVQNGTMGWNFNDQ
jgi:hypothetical protein